MEAGAQARLYLKEGMQVSNKLEASISMKEAQRLMADTTMINPFNQEHELSDSNFVQFGMLIGTWIAGIVAAIICLCCNVADTG